MERSQMSSVAEENIEMRVQVVWKPPSGWPHDDHVLVFHPSVVLHPHYTWVDLFGQQHMGKLMLCDLYGQFIKDWLLSQAYSLLFWSLVLGKANFQVPRTCQETYGEAHAMKKRGLWPKEELRLANNHVRAWKQVLPTPRLHSTVVSVDNLSAKL